MFGAYVFALGINHLPFLVYALSLRKNYGDIVDMSDSETRRLNPRYSNQQFLIFIPLFTVALAVVQWRRA